MAKTTKRSKKFVARGGVKAMLEKGTVTKKGKLKGRRGGGGGNGGGNNHKKRQREHQSSSSAAGDGDGEDDDDAGGHDEGRRGRAHHEGPGAGTGKSKRRRRGTTWGEEGDDADADDEGDFVASADEQVRLGGLDMESFFRTSVAAADDGGGDDFEASDEEDELLNDDSDDEGDSEEEHDGTASLEGYQDGEGSSGSEDDDDDVERAERRMRRQMQKLSSQDPEFHKFLDENERSLLEFGEEISDDDDGHDSGSGEDDGSAESGTDDEADERDAKGRKRRGKTEGEGPAESNKTDEDSGTKRRDTAPEKGKKDTAGKSGQRKRSDDGGADDRNKSGQVHLTLSVLKTYERNAFSEKHGSIKGLRRFVSAYRMACHLADSAAKAGDESSAAGGGGAKYRIESAAAFDRLMVTALRRCHEAFRRHLLGDGGDAGAGTGNASKKACETGGDGDAEVDQNQRAASPKVLARSSHWNAVRPILNTFLKSTLHILSEAKEPKLVTFILRQLSRYMVFLAPFPRVARGLLKTCTALWSAAVDDVAAGDGSREEYQSVRLQAFLRIRQMAVSQPYPFVEDCLKHTYLSYARVAKFSSEATLPTLTFMGNCVVELYSLDVDSSYQHAFVYIRQLALHLRSALQKKTKEATQVVYCWQFINCLKVWTAVLCANPGEKELRSLVYPLVEIILGTARLLPTTRYLPLRFHCVRLLQQLAASTELFVPTTSVLLDVLDLKELSMKPKRPKKKGSSSSPAAGTRLHLILRLPKDDPLRTMEQLDACVNEAFLLFNREVELYRYSPGFPEFSIRICQRLRKFSKETRVGRWRAFAKGCIELCDNYSAFAIEKRALLIEAPKDVKRLEMLKPQDAPNMKTRHERALAKERKLEVTSQPALSKTSEEKELTAKVEPSVKDKSKSSKQKKEGERKKPIELTDTNLSNVDVLKEEDEVEEGVEWSDADSD